MSHWINLSIEDWGELVCAEAGREEQQLKKNKKKRLGHMSVEHFYISHT